jgi:hypothetical protein
MLIGTPLMCPPAMMKESPTMSKRTPNDFELPATFERGVAKPKRQPRPDQPFGGWAGVLLLPLKLNLQLIGSFLPRHTRERLTRWMQRVGITQRS